MNTPTIALLTDFGLEDWFIGTMKGVIRNIHPEARVIDISHDVPPQNVTAGGFVLWNSYRYFPKGTVFVPVVDPGVGSSRKVLVVRTNHYTFVAPDNHILDLVLDESSIEEAVYAENQAYFLDEVSTTFHGRDIFSPVGAYVSRGVPLKELGPTTTSSSPHNYIQEVNEPGTYKGYVTYIDRFGNLLTNLLVNQTPKGRVEFAEEEFELQTTYSSVRKGETLALVDSSGLVEIAVRNGNAQQTWEAEYEQPITLHLKN